MGRSLGRSRNNGAHSQPHGPGGGNDHQRRDLDGSRHLSSQRRRLGAVTTAIGLGTAAAVVHGRVEWWVGLAQLGRRSSPTLVLGCDRAEGHHNTGDNWVATAALAAQAFNRRPGY